MIQNYYKILGLDTNSSISEIKRTYRALVKLYHPDVSNSANAHEEFISINEAYRAVLNYKLGHTNSYTKSNTVSYEDWMKYRREKARKEAAMHAKIRFEEFKRSRIYKSAQVIYQLLSYFYMLLGFAMIIIPVASLLINELDPKNKPTIITATLTLTILGCLFIFMIFSTRKSIKY